MKKQLGISLRYKLLVLLSLLPILFLAVYLVMATQLFSEDKKAYIYDSSVLMATALANQVKMEVKSYKRTVEPIFNSIDPVTFKFSARSKSFFESQSSVEYISVWKRKNKTQIYSPIDQLKLREGEIEKIQFAPGLEAMQKISLEKGIVFSDYVYQTRFFYIMQSHYPVTDKRHYLSLAVYKSPEIFEAFATPTIYKSFLISKSRFIGMRPKFNRSKSDKIKITNFDFFNTIVSQKLPQGTAEVKTEIGYPTLVSFAEVGIGDMMVTSIVDKKAAFATVDTLVSKSILFFVAIICIALFFSVISSISLTSTISKLMSATEEIGKGNFLLDLKLNSRDEFGELARRFKVMAEKVSSLLKATAEQARMENELEMVRVVQENLFPKTNLDVGPFKIIGHFEPASECGGDWFYYSEIDGKVYLWIGDATGHGAPAALITGAARSAAAIIEASQGITPGQALEVMNHALHATAHGSILMTFFLAIVDPETGRIDYANASHEFPYIIPDKPGLKKKDLIPLCDTKPGKRLGEDPSSHYEEGHYQLDPGDSILFYTDGIIDLQDIDGNELGEREFIKAILTSASKSPHISGKVDSLKKIIKDYRGNALLVDDITLFWAQYKK
ncbi:MAG: SpoIIE family protein phosphatase [Bdellovibrionales bacterium]|nr:SpoIIE family protein phosphatase [Bdellovibrionales bacterium]